MRIFTPSTPRFHAQRGFSLVELSVVVAIMAVVAVFGLEAAANFVNRTNGDVTQERLVVVDDAVARFFRIYGRLPCPAVRTTAPTASTYGVEDCSITTITASSSPAGSNLGGGIVMGAVPFRNLNIPMLQSIDGFGSKINYAVTKNLTVAGVGNAQFGKTYTAASPAATDGMGGIEIRSGILKEACTGTCQVTANPTYNAGTNPTPNGAAYVIFSNGADRRGAVSSRGVVLKDCVTTAAIDGFKIDAQNCISTDSTAPMAINITPINAVVASAIPLNVFYNSRFNAGLTLVNYFDDYVLWRPRSRL